MSRVEIPTALDAVKEAAQSFGLNDVTLVTLQSSNNLVLRLDPYPIVAKVGLRPEKHQALEVELNIARHLARKGAPAVRPAHGIPDVVHYADGLAMTFWDFVEVDRHASLDATIGSSLVTLHKAMADFGDVLPSWRDHHDEVLARLHDAVFPGSPAAISMLRTAGERIESELRVIGSMTE